MHNRFIFRYYRVRARNKFWLLRGYLFGDELTHWKAFSNEGTQEGR